MKLLRRLTIRELASRRGELLGRRFEHLTGNVDVEEGRIDSECEIWSGTLSNLAFEEYSTCILLNLTMIPASRLVSLRRGSYTTEDCESCEFGINPGEFRIYEWENGDVSLQSGRFGTDDAFVFYAPNKLLNA